MKRQIYTLLAVLLLGACSPDDQVSINGESEGSSGGSFVFEPPPPGGPGNSGPGGSGASSADESGTTGPDTEDSSSESSSDGLGWKSDGSSSDDGSSGGSSTGGAETAYGDCYDDEGVKLCDGSCVLNVETGASACAPDCTRGCGEGGTCLDGLTDQVVGAVCILACTDGAQCDSGLCEVLTDLTVGGEPLMGCVWP